MTRPEWRVQGTKPLMHSHIKFNSNVLHAARWNTGRKMAKNRHLGFVGLYLRN